MKHRVYMKVTKDEYEFPIATGETLGELAEKLGTTKKNIQVTMSVAKKNGWNSQYKKVIIEDEVEE